MTTLGLILARRARAPADTRIFQQALQSADLVLTTTKAMSA